MSKTIGVIGLGSIGMRHAKNLQAMGHNVRAYDTNKKRLLEFNGALWTIDEVLDSDAVVIASPTKNHAHHLHVVASDGKPSFVEKPISDAPFLQDSMPLMVGYNLRWHSCVKKAKEWLDAGLIGRPLWANFTVAQWNDKPAYLRDGVILNWSHEIDLALYLLGSGNVAASSTRLSDGRDDMTDILLTHKSGCRTTVHLDYLTKPEIRQFNIAGTKGKIYCNLVARNAWIVNSDDQTIDKIFGVDSFNENYVEEMQAFLDRIDGKETLGATGAEGLAALEICLKVREQAGL